MHAIGIVWRTFLFYCYTELGYIVTILLSAQSPHTHTHTRMAMCIRFDRRNDDVGRGKDPTNRPPTVSAVPVRFAACTLRTISRTHFASVNYMAGISSNLANNSPPIIVVDFLFLHEIGGKNCGYHAHVYKRKQTMNTKPSKSNLVFYPMRSVVMIVAVFAAVGLHCLQWQFIGIQFEWNGDCISNVAAHEISSDWVGNLSTTPEQAKMFFSPRSALYPLEHDSRTHDGGMETRFTNEKKLTNETIKHMVHMVWFAHSAGILFSVESSTLWHE